MVAAGVTRYMIPTVNQSIAPYGVPHQGNRGVVEPEEW